MGSNPPKPPKRGRGYALSSHNGSHKISISPTTKFGSSTNFDKVIKPHSSLRVWYKMAKFKFKMADGRHIGKCGKCYNSKISAPIGTKLGLSHPIMSLTCPPWCGCHGYSRCLATAHWTFSSYGRLKARLPVVINQDRVYIIYSSSHEPSAAPTQSQTMANEYAGIYIYIYR